MLPTIVVGETTLLGWMGSKRTGSVVKNQHTLVHPPTPPPPLVLCIHAELMKDETCGRF